MTEIRWGAVMKRIGRIVTVILVVFVLAVIWYAHSGEAVVVRYVLTNAAGVARGTVWVRSDKGLFGGPVTAVAALPSRPAIVYAGTREGLVLPCSCINDRRPRREGCNRSDGSSEEPLVRSHPDRSPGDACSIGKNVAHDDSLT